MEEQASDELLTELIVTGRDWMVNDLPGVLVVVIVFLIVFKIVRFSFHRLKQKLINRADKKESVDTGEAVKRINTLTGISYGFVRVLLWIVFLMMLLQNVGINIGPLLASVGIISLAVGFGAQELVRDYISGFFMLLENQIRAGDVAILNGTGGFVERIELRTTILRDFSGIVHVFQNGKINSLSNMTKEWSAMVFDIGVAYKEDIEKVIDIMKQVGNELSEDPDFKDLIISPLEVFGLDDFADSALIIKARIMTKPIQQWTVGREYRKRLKQAFDRNNIEIPFPHRTVYWGQEISSLKVESNNRIQGELKQTKGGK
ncbi:MAG: mechanosensitive ion channel family protein [Balneolaceae bacterium]|nr:MAG: mechanosensitive ion channel family protein [Balneolaceae bacterium]